MTRGRQDVEHEERALVVCDRSALATDVLVRGLRLCGVEAVAAAWGQDAPVPPAAVLLDADPPLEDVAAAAARLRPGGEPLLLLARHPGEPVAELARRLGAAGRVSRGQSLDDLATAVRLALAGRAVPRPVAVPPAPQDAGVQSLTVREREVLALLATGVRNDAVAQRLRISPHTVRTHVQNVLAKLGVDNRLAAAALARTHGLVPTGADR